MSVLSDDQRERRNAELRRQRRENPEKFRAHEKKWRDANPEKLLAKSLRRRGTSSDKKRAAAMKYHWANLEKRKAYQKKYRKENREKVNSLNRRWFATHAEQERKRKAAWAKANPIMRRIRDSRRRTRAKNNGGTHTVADWIVLCWASAWRCYYCGLKINEKTAVCEHKIPIVRGGSDDISNIAVSCAVCNYKKNSKTDIEFMNRQVRA